MARSVDPSSSAAARSAALDLLARHDRSRGQLVVKLTGKGFGSEAVEAAVSELVAANLVNDRRFVGHFVAYHADRGDGPMKIRHALRAADIETELIDEALDEIANWPERAARSRVKKFGASAPAQYSDKARQARFLAARGFTGAQIRLALDFNDDET